MLNWDKYTGDDGDFSAAASEIIDFVQFDIRNHIVRRLPLIYSLKMFGKLARREMNYLSPNAVLEKYYRELLYGDTCLYELPDLRLHILATNVVMVCFRYSIKTVSIFRDEIMMGDLSSNTFEVRWQHSQRSAAHLRFRVFPPVEISAEDLVFTRAVPNGVIH